MTEQTFPALMKPEEVSKALLISLRHVRTLCQSGVIPGAFKLGKEWRIGRQTFTEWLNEKATSPIDATPPPKKRGRPRKGAK